MIKSIIKTEQFRNKPNFAELVSDIARIKSDWLAPDAFDGLDDTSRDFLLMMLETGCRADDLTGLAPCDIVLDDPIPHICIGNSITSKNPDSQRKVPLVGLSLAAANRHPDGFPDCRGYHTLAKLHRFFDRTNLNPGSAPLLAFLRAQYHYRVMRGCHAGIPIIEEMMGWRCVYVLNKPTSLAERQRLATLIMYPVPPHLA